jgi:hypothetical protein
MQSASPRPVQPSLAAGGVANLPGGLLAAQAAPAHGPPVAAVSAGDVHPTTVSGSHEVTWQDVAGPTWLSQAKTVLALIGVLAIVVHALKLAAG